MNNQGTSHDRSPWHLSTWSDYFARFVHPMAKGFRQQVPVRMTRRQELLAAQEKKRQEHRAHVLELLHEVREKHQHAP
jgi:hypothetical protein